MIVRQRKRAGEQVYLRPALLKKFNSNSFIDFYVLLTNIVNYRAIGKIVLFC